MSSIVDEPIVIILGAGEPFIGADPSALAQTSGNRRVLDWLLEAFNDVLSDPEFHFVGGYRMDEVVNKYPEIHFSRNERWQQSGTIASLFTAPVPTDRPVYICYADTIFESDVVEALSHDGEVDATIAIDRSWQTRYRSRSEESLDRAEKVQLDDDDSFNDMGTSIDVGEADAEFTGLACLSPKAVERSRALWKSQSIDTNANLPDLFRALNGTGTTIEPVDIGDNWAELETGEDLSRFVLDTKANTLRRLQSMVEESAILDQYTFTVGEYETAPDAVTDGIREAFDGEPVIVRSSALAEDSWEESNAGRFESVLNIPSNDPTSLTEAIDRVVDSYPDDIADNQVLIQPMIDDVDQSGVVMTRTLDAGSPYYVINYDATTESTESVTDGTGAHLQTAIVRKDIATNGCLEIPETESSEDVPTQYPDGLALESLLRAVRELEELIGHDSLDVEFTIDADGTVYVLQTRPMTIDPAEHTIGDEDVYRTIDEAREEFREAQPPSPQIVGDRTMYGVMPDWNPAEIIGRQPRRLAASLYRYLIMNETWATQRAEYGYRDVRPHPLMKHFAGQPYVDVRADFNSFIPASVPDHLAERLVEYYIDRLEANPEYHDKVEFDIAINCLPFDYEERIETLLDAGFTEEELESFRDGLREITHHAFDRIDDDLAEIERLEERFEELTEADLPPIREAYYLLEDCRRLGTLPFAHLARTAFVATTLLRSLERKGVLTADERSAFQNSLNTVARQFERDGYRVADGDLEWEAFVDRYGHLRPGTYEITSPAYAQQPEEYLRPIVETATEPADHPDPVDVWDADTKRAIKTELEAIGLPADVDRFIEFLVDAIEGREHSKFVFSQNLSRALELIAAFGDRHGYSRDELSHVPIEDFVTLTVDRPAEDVDAWLDDRIRAGREHYAMTCSVELPPLLFDERDFLVFERPSREPNFVTNQTIRADVVELDGDDDAGDLNDKLVLIPQADPGYDWVFGHDIAGLITMYGGANSHMAVRAAEFSLPAAIGVGENRYEQLRRADVIELDCAGLSTTVIR